MGKRRIDVPQDKTDREEDNHEYEQYPKSCFKQPLYKASNCPHVSENDSL